jgi:hypothetical protein
MMLEVGFAGEGDVYGLVKGSLPLRGLASEVIQDNNNS